MIDKGNIVLDGKLNDILTRYGKNSVMINFTGDGKIFDTIDILAKTEHYPNHVEVTLKEGYSANELLKRIIDKIEISSLHTMRSSLNEIFIALAGGNHNA
jgi:ABC-2 type transport system ATP-binding protein